MRHLNRVVLSFCGLLMLGVSANAQGWGRDPYYRDPYYRGDPYGRNREGYNDPPNSQYLIDRVMADLDRAASRAHLDGHESKHFNEVAENLREFEDRWARGKFDSGKLDKAIHNLEHLADADRVWGRDRDMLARDLEDLREFRATRGRYGQDPNYYPNWR